MAPLEINLSVTFDDTKHIVDLVAKEYLKRASISIQNFIPVKVVADGNCLFNSIISLALDSNVSAIELRGLSSSFNLHTTVLLMNSGIYFSSYSNRAC